MLDTSVFSSDDQKIRPARAVLLAVVERLLQQRSIVEVGAVGNDNADNTAAFNHAEGSSADWWYLPPGTYRTTHMQLGKVYTGPGVIRMGDGYLQSGMLGGFERPRSAVGPVTIESPNDLVLAPRGAVQASGRRIVNVAPGVFPRDVATMQNLLDRIPVTIEYETGEFTPLVYGGTTAGVGTYIGANVGRYTRVGRLLTVFVRIRLSSHTGTGQLVIRGMPFTPATHSYYGTVAADNLARGAGALVCYSFRDDNSIRLALDNNNSPVSVGLLDGDGATISLSITYEIEVNE